MKYVILHAFMQYINIIYMQYMRILASTFWIFTNNYYNLLYNTLCKYYILLYAVKCWLFIIISAIFEIFGLFTLWLFRSRRRSHYIGQRQLLVKSLCCHWEPISLQVDWALGGVSESRRPSDHRGVRRERVNLTLGFVHRAFGWFQSRTAERTSGIWRRTCIKDFLSSNTLKVIALSSVDVVLHLGGVVKVFKYSIYILVYTVSIRPIL